jgi:hypothetical protein
VDYAGEIPWWAEMVAAAQVDYSSSFLFIFFPKFMLSFFFEFQVLW